MVKLTRQAKWLCNWKTWEDISFDEAIAYLAKLHYTLNYAYNKANGTRVMMFHKKDCATEYRLELDPDEKEERT